MLSVFRHEIKQYGRSAIIWNVSLVLAMVFYMSLYPAFSEQAAALEKFMASFPTAVRQALGLELDAYASIAGFYAMVLTYITLAGAIQAMNIGTSIVSKEEREKTAEFLLAKPISRLNILTAKFSAGLSILLITNVVFIAAARFTIAVFSKTTIDTSTFILLSATLGIVQLFFFVLGFLLSVSAKKIKSVLSVSLSVVFLFYMLGILDSVLGVESVRYVTPFKYFDMQYIIKNGSYEWIYVAIEAVLVITAIAFSYFIFQKRDIHTV